jgi:hypothetical protein
MPGAVTIRVLIANYDPLISTGLAAALREQRDFEVAACGPDLTEFDSLQGHFRSRYRRRGRL